MSFIHFRRHTKVHVQYELRHTFNVKDVEDAKPLNIDHAPAHSHPRTQDWKICNGSRRYFWFQSIFQLLKINDDDFENILPLLESSQDGLTIKTRSVVPLSNFVRIKVQ